MIDGPVERALRGEGSDVALVEDRSWQRHPPPAAIAPGEGRVVDDPGRAVDALGLEGRTRVRTGRSAVETEGVVGARARLVHGTRPPAARLPPHGNALLTEEGLDALWTRCPHPEPVHHAVFPARPRIATGNRPSSAARLVSPPGTASPSRTLTQAPPGSATVVPDQSSASPVTRRGTTTASPPVRVKATAWDDAGPRTGSGS